jgi:hypothetical protein
MECRVAKIHIANPRHALVGTGKRPSIHKAELFPSRRQSAPYSRELEADIVLTEPQPRQRTPSAWMRFCTPFGNREGSRISLHWMAALHCTAWQN